MVEFLTAIPNIIWWVLVIYAISVVIFMVLENKSPQLTIAWIFAFVLLPALGPIVYFMFGRDYRAFSRKDKLLRQELVQNLSQAEYLVEAFKHQEIEVEKLKKNGPLIYGRVVEMMRRNANSALFPNNALELLQNGAEKYPRLLADLRAAKYSIHMEYFEWASDPLMDEVKAVLLERAKAGVKVRVLYDPMGCFFMLKRQDVQEMNAGGVRILPWSNLLALHTISYRSHRKIVVIDGQIGYIGGLNMSEAYLKGPDKGNFTGWRDIHTRVTGEIVWALQSSFAIQWYNTTKERLTEMAYYPPLAAPPDYLPLMMVNSGPDAAWKGIRNLYFGLINGATDHIYVQSPFFILDEGLAEAFATAARTGVDVQVMLAPDGPDKGPAYPAGRTYAANMAQAGVKIFNYQGDYFHAKTIMVDSVICSIGSANMDIRSFNINYESNLVVFDAAKTRELEQVFHDDLKKCVKFDVEAYESSNIFGRARDSLMRLGSPLL